MAESFRLGNRTAEHVAERSLRLVFVAALIACCGACYQSPRASKEKHGYHPVIPVGPLALSDDGKYAAIVCNGSFLPDSSSLVQILDTRSGYSTGVLTRFSPLVKHIEFVSDEFGFLLGCSPDWPGPGAAIDGEQPVELVSSLERLELNGNRTVLVSAIPRRIHSMSVSFDRSQVAVCTSFAGEPLDRDAQGAGCFVYSLDDGHEVSSWFLKDALSMCGVFLGRTNRLLVFADGNQVSVGCVIDSQSGEELHRTDFLRDYISRGLIVSSLTGENVYVFDRSGGVRRISVQADGLTDESIYNINIFGDSSMRPDWIALDPGGTILAVGENIDDGKPSGKGTQFIDLKSGKRLGPVLGIAGPMRFSPDGEWLYFPGERIHPNSWQATTK